MIAIGPLTLRLAAALPLRAPAPVSFGDVKSSELTSVQLPLSSADALTLNWKSSRSSVASAVPIRHCSPV